MIMPVILISGASLGTYAFIKLITLLTLSSEAQKQRDIDLKDERNVAIRGSAAWTTNMVYASCFSYYWNYLNLFRLFYSFAFSCRGHYNSKYFTNRFFCFLR